MNKLTKEQKMHALSTKIELLKKRGKIFTNQEIYMWIEWHYGKKRWWTDKYILHQLKWNELKEQSYSYPKRIIGKYMHVDELKSKLKSILNDYA